MPSSWSNNRRSLKNVVHGVFQKAFATLALGLSLVGGLLNTGPAYAQPALRLDAQAWLLVDHHSGAVLTEHRADQPLAPASLTKLMTAYLVFERLRAGTLKLTDPVRVSASAAAAPASRLYLRAGESVSVEELLKGMIVRSANDATVALAEHVSGSETAFVAQMNERAEAWGMVRTRFVNATGLDRPGHVSTARDMSRTTSALIRDFPDYYAWFALKHYAYHKARQYNSNALLWRDDSVDGVKTGHTRGAGFCLVASAKRDDMRLIATVMGARDDGSRLNAAQRLLDYGFRNFETRLVYAANHPATQTRIWMGATAELALGVAENLYVTLPRGGYAKLKPQLTIEPLLQAPVKQGQKLGVLALKLEEQVLGEYPLVALQEIGAGGLFQRTVDGIRLWFH